MPILSLMIWLGCIITVYADATALRTGIPRSESTYDKGFGYLPPGGWAITVLFLGPIGSLLYVLATHSRVGVAVLVVQVVLVALAARGV